MESMNNNRVKYLLIFFGAAVVFILVIGLFRSSPPKKQEPPVPVKVNTPEIKSTIPYSPQSVEFNKDYPASADRLPVYKISGPLLTIPSYSAVILLAKNFGFVSSPKTIPAYGGGTNYIFSDEAGRVLTVKDTPLSLSYSELQKENITGYLPKISQAESLAKDLAAKAAPNLPEGWRLGVTKSVYLKGTGSSAVEVASAQEANMIAISLGYYYTDYKIVTPDGKFEFVKAVFGNSGSVVSFKSTMPVNNPGLSIEKDGDVLSLDLEEVKKRFANGQAGAVFLGLAVGQTDEPILTPPQIVVAESLEPVLVLSPSALEPYYLVTASGTLNSGRVGEVLYLLSVSGISN